MIANLKICGITRRETACFCAEAGVGALGAVFFPKSPRRVTPMQAHALFQGLPASVARVGVFVNMPPHEVETTARTAELDTVQLHGSEPLSDILFLQETGLRVIKVLALTGESLLRAARALPVSTGIMVECGQGSLPGGNGATWQWADAAPLATVRPYAIAGGLTPANFQEAVRVSQAWAWDVSSGVESQPGVKSHEKILKLIEVARTCVTAQPTAFWKNGQAAFSASPAGVIHFCAERKS